MEVNLGLIFSLPAAPTAAILRVESVLSYVSKCMKISILVRHI